MRSMLILTDFSEAAFRAAEYACELSGSLQTKRIVLYHAYQTIIPPTDLPVFPIKENHQIYLESMEALGLLHDRLKPMVGAGVKIDMLATDAVLPEQINQLAKKEEIDVIVMGVSGRSGIEKLLMGSTTSRVLETSEFPVLIVPGKAPIGKGVKGIVFTTDLKDTSGIPADRLQAFLDAFKADVYVVNVDPATEETYSPEMKEAIAGLHGLLDKYHAAFHYLHGNDIAERILSFAGAHHASLVIAVPKARNFVAAVFHSSVSEKLTHNSHIPLLSLPALR